MLTKLSLFAQQDPTPLRADLLYEIIGHLHLAPRRKMLKPNKNDQLF